MDAVTLITVAKSTKTIAAFVSGGGLSDAISMVVGDVHFNAAKLAIKTSEVSANPEGRVNSAITHLEASHSAYAAVHRKADGLLKKSADWQQIRNSVTKDAWVCCLMALCYAYLEDYQAVESSLSLAEGAFADGKKESEISDRAALVGIPLALISLLNIRNWQIMPVEKMLTERQFLLFRSELAQLRRSLCGKRRESRESRA
jgi:hypothetical protein